MGVPYPLTASAIKWTCKGRNVAFGLEHNPQSFLICLRFIEQLSDGTWQNINQGPERGGQFWRFAYAGPMMNKTDADPDGYLDPATKELLNFETFIGRVGASGAILNYINEVNAMCDAMPVIAGGQPAPAPAGFSPQAVIADLERILGTVRVENERLKAA